MSESERPDPAYVESQVIMTTVRVVAPFSLTYGLFLTFHGADSPGGSFQGGAIVGATILMIAFAFGIEPTRDWLKNRTIVALAAGGTAVFTLVGLVPLLLGDSFLAHPFYEAEFDVATKWGLEAIEVGGIAPIVASVVIGLFFVLAAGVGGDDELSGEGPTGAESTEVGAAGDGPTEAGAVGDGPTTADESGPDSTPEVSRDA